MSRLVFIFLYAVVVICQAKEDKDVQVRDKKSEEYGEYGVVPHLIKELYSLKSVVEGLEKSTKMMARTINSQREQIVALRNRKQTRCESGVVGQHHMKAKWPYSQDIKFKNQFLEVPAITYGLNTLDFGVIKNIRVHAYTKNVTTKGLRFVLHTWADTKMYGARIRWMACAPST